MKTLNKITILFLLLLSFYSTASASHVQGSYLRWLPGNWGRHKVQLIVYIDCSSNLGGIGGIKFINITNSCGFPATRGIIKEVSRREVSQICPGFAGQSQCQNANGTVPGVREIIYETEVNLGGNRCNSWVAEFEDCCRNNNNISNLSSGSNTTIRAELNNINSPYSNKAPYVTNRPIPYVCLGVNVNYCPAVVDPDGDSLYFSMTTPMSGPRSVVFSPPYNFSNPLSNFTFDSSTGCISFNQAAQGKYVLAYKIESFDSLGNFLQSTVVDFQFIVLSSNNCQPPIGPLTTGVTGATNGAKVRDLNTVVLCEQNSVCFDLVFQDSTVTDSLMIDSVGSNIFSLLPGVVMTQVGVNPATFNFCWTVPQSTPKNTLIDLTVSVLDGGCPIFNFGSYAIKLIINPEMMTMSKSISVFACPGSPITLNMDSILESKKGYEFSWYEKGVLIGNDSVVSVTPIATSGNYLGVAIDTSGPCPQMDSLEVITFCCELPSISTKEPSCNGGSDGAIYLTPKFLSPNEIQEYSYVDGISGGTLQNSTNILAGMTDSLINIGSGAYIITMKNANGCDKDTTIYLTEPDPLIILPTISDTIICSNDSVLLGANASGGNGGAAIYTWVEVLSNTIISQNASFYVSPNISPSCYAVFATDNKGCYTDTGNVCIGLYPEIIASTSQDSLFICPGTTAMLDINSTGGSGTGNSYEWYQGGLLFGNSTTVGAMPQSSPTTYIGVALDNCKGVIDSVTIVASWYDKPILDFVKNKPDSCFPVNIGFSNTSRPNSLISSFEWVFSDGTSFSGDSIQKVFDSLGCQDVTLRVTTIDGCVFDTTKLSYVCPSSSPIANFSANSFETDLLNTEIDFVNLSSGKSPLSFQWTFNSGLVPDSTSLQDPSFIFSDKTPGTYPVTLLVVDSNGCTNKVTKNIIINGAYTFYTPNTFSPNSDGHNDVFMPSGLGLDLSKFRMFIFNRWGELLFQSDSMINGWDGTYKGIPAQVDTYVWKIQSKEDDSAVRHTNYGHVNLVR